METKIKRPRNGFRTMRVTKLVRMDIGEKNEMVGCKSSHKVCHKIGQDPFFGPRNFWVETSEERSDKVGGYPQQGASVRGKSATEESRLKATKSRRLVDKGQRKGGMGTHCKALLGHVRGGGGGQRKWY